MNNVSKIDICASCIHSACGTKLNKCSTDALVCSQTKTNVNTMVENSTECPKGYWSFIKSPSCGCKG